MSGTHVIHGFHAVRARPRLYRGPGPLRRVAAGGRHGAALGPRGAPALKPVVAVIGGSTCSDAEAAWAADVGRLLARAGAVVVCGGLGGVMEAAARGAKELAASLTIGILPGTEPRDANAYIDVPLATGMGEMRNALIVRVAQAVIAIGGGWGTLSEIALAQRIGTPVVGLHDAFATSVAIPRVDTPGEAAAWALERARRPAV